MTPIVIIPLYGARCKDFLIPCLCFPIHKQNIHLLLLFVSFKQELTESFPQHVIVTYVKSDYKKMLLIEKRAYSLPGEKSPQITRSE